MFGQEVGRHCYRSSHLADNTFIGGTDLGERTLASKERREHYYLLACPTYQRARHSLSNALGRQAASLSYILTDPAATPHLIRYVNATGRMKAILGEIPLPRPPAR
ncbi:uncharacterized protein F5147DRAFT_577707 [Suillus discolor]|uniref:Uncharacterized protein n=1 Tax=Suillus discolor TaxID=1912936 RepID=A0A9P7F7B2_9AGAM|nr:uncharacterized protein F5147DRAFT_577707 [Suillus discolor]KAG2107525.1 hypothetical protein F5147DRAFT_577707 [Suillus discolor]